MWPLEALILRRRISFSSPVHLEWVSPESGVRSVTFGKRSIRAGRKSVECFGDDDWLTGCLLRDVTTARGCQTGQGKPLLLASYSRTRIRGRGGSVLRCHLVMIKIRIVLVFCEL